MKKRAIFIVFLASMVVAACTNKEAEEEGALEPIHRTAETTASESTPDKVEENTEEEAETKKEVEIRGEVTVEEDNITFDGKSNLYPGTVIDSRGVSTLHVAMFDDQAEVQEDGSFQFEFKGYEDNAELTFEVSPFGKGEEFYGDGLLLATGPQVYKTYDEERQSIRVEVELDADKEKPYTIPVEPPVWKELPVDYGAPEVWMDNIEVTSDHEYLYVYGESNLLEGLGLSFVRMHESGKLVPFNEHTL